MNRNCPRYAATQAQQPAGNDAGPEPLVVNIAAAAARNMNFRSVLWTGKNLQVVLMSIVPGDDIGLEVHPNVDQFIRVEVGQGIVKMGPTKENLTLMRRVFPGDAIMVPAGTWHDVINTGGRPLRVYTIYAPPQHPRGAVYATKTEAQAAES